MDKKENKVYNDKEQVIQNLLAYMQEVEQRYRNYNFGMSTIDVLKALEKCLTGKYEK